MNPWAPGHAHLGAHSTCAPRGWGTWLVFCPHVAGSDQFFTPFPAREKPPGLNIGEGASGAFCWVCACLWCTRICTREGMWGSTLPSQAVCSGARCARFRSALADSPLMVLGAGQTTLLVLQAEGVWLSQRELCRSCRLAHLAKRYEKNTNKLANKNLCS